MDQLKQATNDYQEALSRLDSPAGKRLHNSLKEKSESALDRYRVAQRKNPEMEQQPYPDPSEIPEYAEIQATYRELNEHEVRIRTCWQSMQIPLDKFRPQNKELFKKLDQLSPQDGLKAADRLQSTGRIISLVETILTTPTTNSADNTREPTPTTDPEISPLLNKNALTVEEAATVLRYSERTIRTKIHGGILKTAKMGPPNKRTAVRVLTESVKDLLKPKD